MNDLVENTVLWALDRNIIQDSDLKAQLSKLAEEFGELASGINKDKPEVILDSIGDMTVVLIILAEVYGKRYEVGNIESPFDFEWESSWFEIALEQAYNTIKDRKGKLIEGVFVKEE